MVWLVRSREVTQWRTRTEKRTVGVLALVFFFPPLWQDLLELEAERGGETLWARVLTFGVAGDEADPGGLAVKEHEEGQVRDGGGEGRAGADECAECHGAHVVVLVLVGV